jgi:hypothetical protein
MIGVLCRDSEREIVREFFEFFKTPWEFYRERKEYRVVISSLPDSPAARANLHIFYYSLLSQSDIQNGLSVDSSVSAQFPYHEGVSIPIYGRLASLRGIGNPLVYDKLADETYVLKSFVEGQQRLRVGYDLFYEIAFLLTEGQPLENALVPTLELHISLLREWIVGSGLPLVEIPPVPWGHKFAACLTHDVDFGGIRQQKLDHTIWGFLYRALIGSLLGIPKGTRSFAQLAKNWIAVLSLPLVYIGIVKDLWDDFGKYAEIEKGLSSTFFLIPFKDKAGENVTGRFSARRATRYDISDVRKQVDSLINQGFEIGLHGIDAWHNAEKAREEINRIAEVTGQKGMGVRIHWLSYNRYSSAILERAGFNYDSTFGYNETIGYKAGTTQVFRPLGVSRLLELPLHIQDTALFYPRRLALTHGQAWNLCRTVLKAATGFGGVVTISWHQRSLAPERLWDEFYVRLLQELKSFGAWFGTASQVVQWFRRRRSVVFEDCCYVGNTVRLRMNYESTGSEPPMFLRVHRPGKGGPSRLAAEHRHIDYPYTGESFAEISFE